MKKFRNLPIRLTDEMIAKIEAHPSFRPSAPGVSGGVSSWIREAIYERLNEPVPMDYHRAKSERLR